MLRTNFSTFSALVSPFVTSPLLALSVWGGGMIVSPGAMGAIASPLPESFQLEGKRPLASPNKQAESTNLASELGFQYRVFVLPRSESHEQQLRQLVEGAFSTTVQGRRVLQVGLFRDRQTADEFRQQLREQGVIAHVLPVETVATPPGITPSPAPTPDSVTPATPPNATPSNPDAFTANYFNLPAPNQSVLSGNYTLWATYYRLHQANIASTGFPLLDRQGNSLGITLSHRDWCDAALQGSVQIRDGARIIGTYNFAGRGTSQQVDCAGFFPTLRTVQDTGRVRFGHANGPFGDGAGGFILVPYRTIAVDRSVIPLGSVIYIPSARGQAVTLPSGEQIVHDGYFYAADVGNAIQGNHIDVFAGTAQQSPFPFVQSRSSSTFAAYLVNDPAIRSALDQLHRVR